jgi:Arc/MetJ-type ribon-helix-helix transcriptional regulator
MKNTGISLPQRMIDEIEERRDKGESRAKYIRDALRGRFDREDAGEWRTPDANVDAVDAPADD